MFASDAFKGKAALITGGTSGIGRDAAIALARHGAHVVVTGRRDKEGAEVAAAARDAGKAHGVKALFVKGDVTSEAHVEEAVKAAASITGRLDLAFNNAGVELGGFMIADSTPEQYKQVMDINVLGVMLAMKHEIRAMRKNGKAGGAIVNTASVAGSIGMPGAGIYIASKHAVLGLTRSAALEVANEGIRVNAVSPGAIETPMLDRFTGNRQPDTIKYMESLHPVGRLGTPPEVTSVVLFLLSPGSAFVTGADYRVDGGLTVP